MNKKYIQYCIFTFLKMSDFDCDTELNYPSTYELPVLYCIDKRGKERVWKIWTVDDTVRRIQGLVSGKKQTYSREYTGKNIGKKNETTAEEQAIAVANTMWTKQLDKGYLPKCKEGKAMVENITKMNQKTGGHNSNARAAIGGSKEKKSSSKLEKLIVPVVEKPVKPMKASVWKIKDGKPLPRILKHFDFSKKVYVQPKLDGWRCIARLQGDKVVLTTNNGKQYPWFENLRKEIANFVKNRNCLDGLDGEIYSHSLDFKTICSMSILARTNPHPLENQINLTVFDLVDLSGKKTQDERFALMKALFSKRPANTSCIKVCTTKTISSFEQVKTFHDDFFQKGYEGVIIRSRDLMYTDKRSLKMRKYKNFTDREYCIVNVEKDKGVDDEYFVWVCEDPDIKDKNGENITFKAKPTGLREDRRYWYNNHCEYLGKMLTVKFQEYTAEGIPRFPVAVGIREDQ